VTITKHIALFRTLLFAACIVQSGSIAMAQQPAPGVPNAADQIADFFSSVGDQIYEECIFELSPEQVEVQAALIKAYIAQGATGAMARKLAVKQIQPPKLSAECERIRHTPEAPTSGWVAELAVPKKPKLVEPPPPVRREAPARSRSETPSSEPSSPVISIADHKQLPQWDCAPNVDYVTIHINGFDRKLTGGEICNPFQDVVYKVPESVRTFRLGYTIKTGRLFVDTEDGRGGGRTIAWGLSGRAPCRNDPDPNCLATRSVGPLPPGEYSFASKLEQRVSWGPKTKRNVAGIYLRKLWYQDRYSPAQKRAILKRGNIAIHMRLKGEMSEACIGMEPRGWSYVASLIKEGRATGVNVYVDEPYPQVAEAPPVVIASSFSLTSLFK
jgi:hypothetical protein